MHAHVKTGLGITVIIIVALMAGMFIWYSQKNYTINYVHTNPPITKQKACTEEAKICPDGSAVGRTGPDCEFAPCPEMTGIADKISILAPAADSIISSPVIVSGRARGTWFFEGDFPVEVYDLNDKLLGQGYASFVPSAEEPEWMTEDFINFSGSIKFSNTSAVLGYILFKKDNPSDLRELDEEFELPVRFSADNASEETLSWRSYENKNFGFSLGFPESWKGYIATEDSQSGNKNVCFNFKDGRMPFCIFYVRVMPQSEWDDVVKKTGYVKITEDEGNVYLCSGCCGQGDTTGGGQFDQFQQERCKEVGKILETFELLVDKG